MSVTIRRDYENVIIIVGILLEAFIVPVMMAIRLLRTNTPVLVSILTNIENCISKFHTNIGHSIYVYDEDL